MSDNKKEKITPEELKSYKAIDTMNRPFSVSLDHLKRMYLSFEFQTLAISTFGGVLKRSGLLDDFDAAWDNLLDVGPEKSMLKDVWKMMIKMGIHGDLDKTLAEMETAGVDLICIDQCVNWSQREHKKVDCYATVDEIAQWSKESKGKIIGGFNYYPYRIEDSLKEMVEAVEKHNFKYIWIHTGCYGLTANDKEWYPLYAKCSELGIPVSMQTGQSAEPLPSEQMRPMYADEVAINFPRLNIVLTHTGWPWVNEWISMLWRHPNVYGNIGAYMPSSFDPALVKFLSGAGRSKVLWATNGLGLTRCKSEFLQLPIAEEAKRAILYDNPKRVFKL